MAELKFNRPYTSSMRGTVLLKVAGSNSPFRSLVRSKKSSGGRNSFGHTTVRFRGGGNKVKYRVIAFKKKIFDVKAKVERLEYDPNRNAKIALLKYDNGVVEYMLATDGMNVGDVVIASKNQDNFSPRNGNSYPLSIIPVGVNVCCVELNVGGGAKIARSAGSFAVVAGKEGGKVVLKMKSGETRLVAEGCMATIGIVSNEQKQNTKLGKAGRKRWLGFRPHTRGECMNPVDHPLGGRTRGGHPVTPWGKSCKGYKTRKNKRTNYLIVKRRSNGK